MFWFPKCFFLGSRNVESEAISTTLLESRIRTFCLRFELNRCQPENALNRAFTLSGKRGLRYPEPNCISRSVLSRFFFRGTVVGREGSELKRSCGSVADHPMEVFVKKSNQYSPIFANDRYGVVLAKHSFGRDGVIRTYYTAPRLSG